MRQVGRARAYLGEKGISHGVSCKIGMRVHVNKQGEKLCLHWQDLMTLSIMPTLARLDDSLYQWDLVANSRHLYHEDAHWHA